MRGLCEILLGAEGEEGGSGMTSDTKPPTNCLKCEYVKLNEIRRTDWQQVCCNYYGDSRGLGYFEKKKRRIIPWLSCPLKEKQE